MTEAGIDGLSRGDNLGKGVIKGLYPLRFVPLDQGATEISTGVEPWLRSW